MSGHWAPAGAASTPRALARRAAWHLSIAVVLFAVLQLVLVGIAVDHGASATLTMGALGVLVGVMIPLARWMLLRWRPDAQSIACRTLIRRYRRDMALLWAAVIVVPFVWVLLAAGATGAVW